MRTGGGKAQTIIVLVVMIVIFAGLTGVIPEEWFIPAYAFTMVAVVGYIVASFMYPFLTLAGKPMLAVSFYTSSSEVEYVFGKVVESENGVLFRECPGGGRHLICAEVQPVKFVSTHVPYRLVVLYFPEDVSVDALFDHDYVEPDSGFGRIPVRIAYVSGVKIGEYIMTEKTAFKSWRDRLLEWLGRHVERAERIPIIRVTRYRVAKVKALERACRVLRSFVKSLKGNEVKEEKAPVILVTGDKLRDIKLLRRVREELKKCAGYREERGSAKAWVTELGSIRLLSTELEELRADNMKLRQTLRALERIFQSPPNITVTTYVTEEGESRGERVVKYALVGVGSIIGLILVLALLGVLSLGH